MHRDYSSGATYNVNFFVGTEIEHTPAYGKKTLFVVGTHPTEIVESLAKNKSVEHIYFGANQSFKTNGVNDVEGWQAWEQMIIPLLKKGWLCTLDLDVSEIEGLHEGAFCEYTNFIPQISVKIPYIRLLNYNACVKIDDKDFKATNPGIWVHQVHDLMDRSKFNDWNLYGKDEIV